MKYKSPLVTEKRKEKELANLRLLCLVAFKEKKGLEDEPEPLVLSLIRLLTVLNHLCSVTLKMLPVSKYVLMHIFDRTLPQLKYLGHVFQMEQKSKKYGMESGKIQ